MNTPVRSGGFLGITACVCAIHLVKTVLQDCLLTGTGKKALSRSGSAKHSRQRWRVGKRREEMGKGGEEGKGRRLEPTITQGNFRDLTFRPWLTN